MVLRLLASFLAAVALTACGTAVEKPVPAASVQPAVWDPSVCGGYTCDGPGAKLGVGYSYRLGAFCGAPSTRFDGRQFYVEAADPSAAANGLNPSNDLGTMTLLSSHLAVFRSSAGNPIRFVDTRPGVIGLPYPMRMYVLSGTAHLDDRGFAGRAWRAQGLLPEVVGPVPGNGKDRLIPVDGTMTLTGVNTAVFHTLMFAEVPFANLGLTQCD